MTASERDQMMYEVMHWAEQTGYEANSILDTGNDFVIEISERPNLPSVQFVHQGAEMSYVLVVGQVRVPKEDRDRLKDWMLGQYAQFIWDIKIALLRDGVDFTVLGEDEKDPDVWEVQKRLYVKGTDANQFQDTYTKVKASLISVIWSYKKALDGMEPVGTAHCQQEDMTVPGYLQGDPERTAKIMNTISNTSMIMMISLMDGFTDLMMQASGTMATGMAEAFGGEEAGREVAEEMERNMPEAKERLKEMVSEVRQDIQFRMGQKIDEIEPLLADGVFDAGPEIVDIYDYGLPKLTEELDDETIERYVQMLVQEDKYFTEMFGQLTKWMSSLPELPK